MGLELSQQQGLSLSLQTYMHLLQLNNLQLRGYLGDLMTSNATVELEYPEIDYRPGPFTKRGGATSGEPSDSREQLLEDKASESSALHDLFLQSAAMRLSSALRQMTDYLILSLDENGFLRESAGAVARALGVPLETVQQGIRLLQSMEPAGVGAANLTDCLRLQLLRLEPVDDIALQIVAAHLPDMARQQYAGIAKALFVPKARVLRSCGLIRSLNPKPLNGQSGEAMTPFILPDFYVVEDGGQLRCMMNDYYLPKIRIDPSYRALLREKALSPEDSAYICSNYQQATDVVKFLSYRKATLQRVVEYILRAQADFFRYGSGHRAAMHNAEIAQALSLHESTVSRAVNGKFFECKWGVFPLKSLFAHSAGGQNEGCSVDELLQRLSALIASESPDAPCNDQLLAERLSAQGVSIARRTVAKYRQMLGIPTAGKRGRKARGGL